MKKVGKNILKGVIYLIIPIIIELLFSKKVILEKSTLIRLAMLYGIEILYFGYFIINKYKEKIKKGINFVINKRYIIIPIIFLFFLILFITLSGINLLTINVIAAAISIKTSIHNILITGESELNDTSMSPTRSTVSIMHTKNSPSIITDHRTIISIFTPCSTLPVNPSPIKYFLVIIACIKLRYCINVLNIIILSKPSCILMNPVYNLIINLITEMFFVHIIIKIGYHVKSV